MKLAPPGVQAESSVERLKTVLSRSSARISITFGPVSGAGVPVSGVVGPSVLTFDRFTRTVSPSPEQASGNDVDRRSDVYAAAIVLWELLTGERLYKGDNAVARKKLTILDRLGRPVAPESIDWTTATPQTFPYSLRQPPGPDNALGRVKFIFPNEHAIFLHDTPSQELSFSSGCIRVEHPLDFAAVLLEGHEDWNRTTVQQVVDTGKTRTVFLAQPLPVLIVYWTVSVGASGDLRYARDVYGLDPAVLRALNAAAPR